jgi:SAM-dependent methyltransferase
VSTWRERLIAATKRLGRDERKKVARILAPVPREARVLEIGCGFGRKLALLRDLGFTDLRGVERNPAVAAAARTAGFTSSPATRGLCPRGRPVLLRTCSSCPHRRTHVLRDLLAFLDQALTTWPRTAGC